ncbi:MAG TPA: DMT family transporter [Deltaproteobacteria bacterium]|nr:DMT family transporter [Deltaproteobacteria bacterium]
MLKQQLNRFGRIGADLMLLIVTFFWGATFILVKDAIVKVGVFVFLIQRFIPAFVFLLIVCLVFRRPVTVQLIRRGIVLGTILFGAFAFQTIALLHTSASNTAFLTGLNVVLVPIVSAFIFRHAVTTHMKAGVLLAALGLFFLCTNGAWSFNRGDSLAGMCAVCVALHVMFTGAYARREDIYWLTTIQLGTVAIFSAGTAVMLGDGNDVITWHPDILRALIFCIVFATVFAYIVQTSMQRYTTPTHTALIFCMEPVFAVLFAYWMINEQWGLWRLIGAVLILAGMIISEASDVSCDIIEKTEHYGDMSREKA